MNYFRSRYFGAKYNTGFTLPPDETIAEITDSGSLVNYGRAGINQNEEFERRVLSADNEFMNLVKIFMQCQN
jgi:hypothetical protein